MPLYPFRYDEQQKTGHAVIELTEKEEEIRRRDTEEIKAHKKYRDQFAAKFRSSAALYNLAQTGTSDVMSNFYLGIARTFIDQSISMMTQAPPAWEFDPGQQDYKLAVLYKALVEDIVRKSDGMLHLRHWMTNMTVMGPGVLHTYVRTPQRLSRIERPDGSIEERIITDLRRSKVGFENISPLSCWRSSYDTNINDVTAGGYEVVLTRAQFVQEFANCMLPSGKKKYKHIDQILAQAGSHFKITFHFHDTRNEYRVYALAFGSEEEGEAPQVPEELGCPILDKPLQRNRFVDEDGKDFVSGHNVLGYVPLTFTGFADRYDKDARFMSLYPMGIPEMIEGPEMILDLLANMAIDSQRNANTNLITYASRDGKTYPDLDVREFYNGQFIDGDITVNPLGVTKMGENMPLMEYINKIGTDLTGINPSFNSDDPARTAFEMAQKVRSNNARAEFRLRGMEVAMQRVGHQLIANSLSELTVTEWEKVTEEEAERIAKLIDQGAMSSDDFNPAKKEKRAMYNFPVHGRKFREDFSSSKNRSLDYNSTSNTLIEDKSMETDTSYVPATQEYLLPSGRIQDVVNFGVTVTMKRMLGDMKAQDMEMFGAILDRTMQIKQMGEETEVQPNKILMQMVEYAQIDPRKVTEDSGNDDVGAKEFAKAIEDLQNISLSSNVPLPQTGSPSPAMAGGMQPPAPNTGSASAPAATPQAPSNALSRYATGAV